MGRLIRRLRLKALRSSVALPLAVLVLHPVGAYSEVVSVAGDPFGDPSATAFAGATAPTDPANSATATGVTPFPPR